LVKNTYLNTVVQDDMYLINFEYAEFRDSYNPVINDNDSFNC